MRPLNRRSFMASAAKIALGCTCGAQALKSELSPASVQGKKKPNFVFIFADDWGWGDLGCYGHPHIKTPNIDRLAKEGTLFTQFYVNGSVCSPSRTAIMTGHFPARHGIHGHIATEELNEKRGMPNFLDPRAPTVTRILQENGYRTGHFGKWHLGSGKGAPLPGAYGIDESKTGVSNDTVWRDLLSHETRHKSTEIIIDESIKFIESNKEQPFFVNVWIYDTHARLNPSEEQMKPYERFLGALRMYYSAATDADRHIGRLLARLEELGLEESTVVIFSSDNGPEDIVIGNASEHGVGSPGPFRGRKRSIYDGGVRSPFIIRFTGKVPAGRIDNTSIVAGVDFLPTVCSLAGIGLPDNLDLDGEDMSGTLLGNPIPRTKPLMWEWRFRIFGHVLNMSPSLAIREGDWKLLLNPDRSRIELYNIPKDPSELNNCADKYPDIVKRLSEKVLAWHTTLPEGPWEPEAGKNDYPWPTVK